MGSLGRNRRDDLGLVVLADVAEELPPPHRAASPGACTGWSALASSFMRASMAARSSGVKGRCVGEVVVEAVLDHRADGHLGLREQLLDRLRQQVRGGMADDLEAVGVPVGDDAETGAS